MSRHESSQTHEEAERIRQAVMLPGFDESRREGVPQAFLEAFEHEDAPAASGRPAHGTAGLLGIEEQTEDRDASAQAGAGAEWERRNTGRHRQRGPRGRKPVLLAAAAVGAVLAVVPFLSQGSGSGRHDAEGRTAPVGTVPDEDIDEPNPDRVEDNTEPVAFAGPDDPGGRMPVASKSPHGDSGRVIDAPSVRSSPPRTDPPATTEPVVGAPDTPEDEPGYAGTVVDGTYVIDEGRPVVAEDARMSMEPDGNFVVRDGSGVVRWAANTALLGSRAVFQGDGNLVVVAADGRTVWHSATHGNPGARLILQNSGRMLIVSAAGALLWSTG